MPAATAAPTRSTLRIADVIADPMAQAVGYAKLLVKDIPAEQFAHMPHPNMNHPAFNIGHLSIYPNRAMELLGLKHLIVEKPGFPELFKAGVACVEQDGRYPDKDIIVGYYVDRYETLGKSIRGVDDEVFARENPATGRFKEMFPTLGGAINFLMNSHQMMHLGQISAWRRAVGLPAVM